MTSIPVSKARLGDIFNSVVDSRQPVRLTSHTSSAIVVGWDQWQAIEETLFRLSTPALRAVRRVRRAERQPHARN